MALQVLGDCCDEGSVCMPAGKLGSWFTRSWSPRQAPAKVSGRALNGISRRLWIAQRSLATGSRPR